MGVSSAQVSYWRSGKRPDGKNVIAEYVRLEFKEMFGIPVDAWDKPAPTTPEEEVEALKLIGRATAPVTPTEGSPGPEGTPSELKALIQRAITQINAIQVNSNSLEGLSEQSRIFGQLTRSMEVVQRTTGEHALTTAKMLQHPEQQRIISKIVSALQRHPEALKDVDKVLDELADQ